VLRAEGLDARRPFRPASHSYMPETSR
jgi:hypothetical protein